MQFSYVQYFVSYQKRISGWQLIYLARFIDTKNNHQLNNSNPHALALSY